MRGAARWFAAGPAVAAVALATGGCSGPFGAPLNSSPPFVPAGPAAARADAADKKRSKPPSGWQAALSRWVQEVTRPGAAPPTVAPGRSAPSRPIVAVDVAAVASRHPAWHLANALERGDAVAPGSPAAPSLLPLALPRSLPPPALISSSGGASGNIGSAGRDSGDGSTAGGSITDGSIMGGGSDRMPDAADLPTGETQVLIAGLQTLQQEAGEEQRQVMAGFLEATATRHATTRTALAEDLRTAMEEDVEAARRVALAELQPDMPGLDEQLQMINLRLDLLAEVQNNPARREQATRQLNELEAQWERLLRLQEVARREELRRLLEERPARLRQERIGEIRTTLAEAEQRDATARQAVLTAHRQRIEQDFGSDTGRLGITLPALASPTADTSPADGGAAGPGWPATAWPGNNRTFRTDLSSIEYDVSRLRRNTTLPGWLPAATTGSAPGAAVGDSGGHVTQIRALRAMAWADARRWIRVATRRAGWTWQADAGARGGGGQTVRQRVARGTAASAAAAPDRTGDVLRILNLH